MSAGNLIRLKFASVSFDALFIEGLPIDAIPFGIAPNIQRYMKVMATTVIAAVIISRIHLFMIVFRPIS
jgi:hypothetical protein